MRFLLLLVVFLFNSCTNSNDDFTIKYCRIDSIININNDGIIPEPKYRYNTNCGIKFKSKNYYHLNDSVKVRIYKKHDSK